MLYTAHRQRFARWKDATSSAQANSDDRGHRVSHGEMQEARNPIRKGAGTRRGMLIGLRTWGVKFGIDVAIEYE